MDDKVIFELFINSDEINEDKIAKWFKSMLFFIPEYMKAGNSTKGNMYRYKPKKFLHFIPKETGNSRLDMMLVKWGQHLEPSDFCKIYGENNISFYSTLDMQTYCDHKEFYMELFEKTIEDYNAIVGYLYSYHDYLSQNFTDYNYFKNYGLPTDNIHFKETNTPHNPIVDIEYNPGHDHYRNGLCFRPSYCMWFGKDFYNYLPQEKIASFEDCYENKMISENHRRILLYENIQDFSFLANRERQWTFRKHVRLDEILHGSEKNPMEIKKNEPSFVEVQDPQVEMQNGSFEHGGILLVKQYFDNNKNPVNKSSARFCHIQEFDKSHIMIWKEIIDYAKTCEN